VVVGGLGGSVSMTVIGHDPATIKKLVEYIQTTQWAGVIFTKDGLEGTFKQSDVGIDSPDAADVIVSMRWGEAKMEGRLPGALICEGAKRSPGSGMHGSLSKYDMHNTLIAAGPSFKKAYRSETPSGNSDVTPTVLSILGIPPKQPLDGRVLNEALEGAAELPKVEASVMRADGKNPHAITHRDDIDPTWSPDGSRIAFASSRTGQRQLFIMNADGSDITQITDLNNMGGRSTWSPDGTKLAFYRGPEGDHNIFVVDVNTKEVTRLTGGGDNLGPSWSPDGNWIAFTSFRDGNNEIYIMHPDGTGVTRLTNNSTSDWQPRWGG